MDMLGAQVCSLLSCAIVIALLQSSAAKPPPPPQIRSEDSPPD